MTISRFSSSPAPAGHTRLPATEALRIAAQLTDTDEDLHAITRVVLALMGEDDDLTGDAAEAALQRAGVPAEARRLLMAALGPPAGRPSVAELRAGLERAVHIAAQGDDASPLARFYRELHRRRVTRTALWYVGGSVAAVEAANLFVPMLGGDVGVVRLLAILAVCGLPIALTLSWVFDVAPTSQPRLARWPRLALLGSVVALSAFGAVMIWRGTAGDAAAGIGPVATSDAADPAHIAVLDFTPIGGDADLAVFATQLQLRLIDGLSAAAVNTAQPRDRTLRVLSHAGVLPFAGRDFALDSLREARRVGTVLQGTVEQTSGGVRVRIRLVDTQTGFQIHTMSADHALTDRVALLDAVADSVSRLVRTRLGPVVRERMRLLETRSPAAFERLLWAQQRLEEFETSLRQSDYQGAAHVLADADSVLAAAERLDPRWVEPIVVRGHLANRRVMLARARGESAGEMAAIDRGIEHAGRALALDPANPRALELRGALRQLQYQVARPAGADEAERLRAAAEHDLRASLMGHPAPAASLRMLSELAAAGGRMQEALMFGERAFIQDPFMEQVQWTVFRLFEYSFALARDSAAARWCRTGRDRFADMPIFQDCRLTLAAWSDVWPLDVDSAWNVVAAELAAYPPPLHPRLEPRLHILVAAVAARQAAAPPRQDAAATSPGALRDSARSLVQAARQRDSSVGVLRAAAGVHTLLGEPDSAYATLRTLLEDHAVERRTLLTATELRGVLRDPRARALLETEPGPPAP